MKGDGDLKGSSIGSKDLEFTFVQNKERISILQIRLNLLQARIQVMSQTK
ncbi:Csa1 family protein [Staphylococcus aureus]|nr:Csa1 family protein [Staphylococcus aureus]